MTAQPVAEKKKNPGVYLLVELRLPSDSHIPYSPTWVKFSTETILTAFFWLGEFFKNQISLVYLSGNKTIEKQNWKDMSKVNGNQ